MYPSIDRFREQPDGEPSGEIVPLERARFIDRLEPENEESWQKMIEMAREAELSLDDFALPIWMDEEMPRAIRDRSLLLMIGNANARQVTGGWNSTMNMGFALYGFNLYSIKRMYPDFNIDNFKQWLEEARNYEAQNTKIISNATDRSQTYAFFDLGIYNEEQFEADLERYDWKEVSPTHGGTGWNGDTYDLDIDRFPYLDDIFKGETTNSQVIKAWARKKLLQFIQTDEAEKETLPSWMQEASSKAALKILRPIFTEWAADRQEFDDILLPAFEVYEWDGFIRKRGDSHYTLKLLDKLPRHLAVSLIEWTLTNYKYDQSHLSTKEVIILKGHVEGLEAVDLFTLIDECLEKSQGYDAEQARKDAEWKRKLEAERVKDPKEIAKRAAQERYKSLLNTIRQTNEVSP